MSIAIRFALAGLVAAALCPGAEVEVVLTDHARVNPVELVPARQEASRLLAAAGIVLRWSTPEPDLGHPARAVVLNILPAEMARRWPAGGEACGYALAGWMAGVFYHCVDQLTEEGNGGTGMRGRLLGALMAHEVGHLLIGPGIHSPTGIMKAHWGSRDLLLIRQGRLAFLPSDAAQIRARLGRPE